MNNTLTRALSGSVYIFLIVAMVHLGGLYLVSLIGVIMFFSIKETISLLKSKGIYTTGVWLSVLMAFTFTTLTAFFDYDNLIGLSFLPLMCLPILHLYKSGEEKKNDFLGNSFIAIAYIGLPTVFALLFAQRDANFILHIFIMLWANDTLAFVFGKWLGKKKLFERLSPKKTVEGFYGGLLGAVLSGVIISLFNPHGYSIGFYILLSIVVAVAGTYGDLFESYLKRSAGVKDSGNVIPGHGGVLDRLDSFLFAAPFAYFCVLIFEVINNL